MSTALLQPAHRALLSGLVERLIWVILPGRNGHETKRKKSRSHGRKGRLAVSNSGLVKVAGYRLYGLDGVNKVASGEWFEADDDQAAIDVAKTLMDGHDCELWQGQRFVTRIRHEQKR